MARERPRTGTLYDQGEWLQVKGVDTWVVRAGARRGTPILFLHGIPTSAFLYRDVMAAMHEERDCIAFDWPGFGSSQKGKHLDLTHQGRAAHLEALVEALGSPPQEIDLVVHDVGGPAGLLYAMRHPERVRRLVILNTTVYKRDYRPPLPALAQFVPVVRELSRPFFNKATFEFFMKRSLARPERMRKSVMDTHWRLAKRDGGLRCILDTWAKFPEGTDAIRELRAKLATFPRETLVLFGAEDPILPPPNAERFAKELPRAQLQLLPGVGHFVQEDAPEVVSERLLKFLSG